MNPATRCPLCWREAIRTWWANEGTSLADNYRQALTRNFDADHVHQAANQAPSTK